MHLQLIDTTNNWRCIFCDKNSLNQKLTVIKNILMVKNHIIQSENLLVFEKKSYKLG